MHLRLCASCCHWPVDALGSSFLSSTQHFYFRTLRTVLSKVPHLQPNLPSLYLHPSCTGRVLPDSNLAIPKSNPCACRVRHTSRDRRKQHRSSNSGAENKDVVHQPLSKVDMQSQEPSSLRSRWLPLLLLRKLRTYAGTVEHSLHSSVCLVLREAAWFTKPHEAF